MNILIPHQWLLDHLETSASPQDVQRILSLSGPSVERIYDKNGESVYDIEVTTNRVDAMSVRGIAREAAVILNHAGVPSALRPLTSPKVNSSPSQTLPLPEIKNEDNLSPRIMCVILKDVKRNSTPDWMAQRLQQVDMNIHDAVIDITNYITHELGHPCHAFDYDKIMALGGQIIVKEAEKGKHFTTLDGMKYETVSGEIVFENQSGEIIDFPGIKGTTNTSIDDETQNVLFWMESIDAKKIRFASMTHAIRTTAAQLNEKKVDPELMPIVMNRGIELYQLLTDAQVASEIVDIYPNPKQPTTIEVAYQRITDYLGLEIPVKDISRILEELECQIMITPSGGEPEAVATGRGGETVATQPTFVVTPPSFRPDLTIPADIIEEIARIYGYHNLPSKIMDTAIPLTQQSGVDFSLENRIKHFLADIGWFEVYTYSMVSEELAKMSGYELDEHFKLQNPLTDDRVYLRNSLIPSLNEVIDNNSTEKKVSVFEIANVYRKNGEQNSTSQLPTEMLIVSMVSTKAYRNVKGDLEALLAQFHITNLSLRVNDPQLPYVSQSAVISAPYEGELYEMGTIVVMKNGSIAVTLGITNIIAVAKKYPNYLPALKTAQITEDLTFTLPEKTLIGDVLNTMKQVSEFITSVALSDVYGQNFTFTIIYMDKEKNLTTQDVEPIRKKLIESLSQEYKAKLVGEIHE